MENNLDTMSALQNSIDEMFDKHSGSKCAMFEDFECSFSKLEGVLEETTNHIEMVDKSLSSIELDILEIKKLIANQGK